MALADEIKSRILSQSVVNRTIRLLKKVVLPGFNGIPLYDVTTFFLKGLAKGYITTRAAAISFSLFLAIFPFLIFLFTIIPFIPIENFQQSLMGIIEDFMPHMAFASIKEIIFDIVTRPRSSLLFFNLALTLYFSTNGVNSLIAAFNNTYHDLETRSTVRQYMISMAIVLINSFLLILAIGLITFGSAMILWILPKSVEENYFVVLVLELLRWLIILGLLLTGLSIIYYLGPNRNRSFRFFSPGSMVATLLVVLTTLGFNFYVDHFSKYNALYGSLGTLIVVLLWIYINAISLLIGFEINASIQTARKQ